MRTDADERGGGRNGGHYYAFIRPLGSNDWFRFDDERVTKVKAAEAIEGQFGGLEHQQNPGHTPQWKYPKISSAYMLVYVRESEIPEINTEVTADDVAAHLRHTLELEQAEKARRELELMALGTSLARAQAHARNMYKSIFAQSLVATVIVASFCAGVWETDLQPEQATSR